MMDDSIHLNYLGTCRCKNKIWFTSGEFNGLFSLDLGNLSVNYESRIPYLEEWDRIAYNYLNLVYNDKLLFMPPLCRKIFVYDIGNAQAHEVVMPLEDFLLVGIIQCENTIWLFPKDLKQGVYILDVLSLQIKKDVEISALVGDIEDDVRGIKLSETEYAFYSIEDNQIIEIDIVKKRKHIYSCFPKNMDIWQTFYDGQNYWAIQKDSTDIYEWNYNENKVIKYCLTEKELVTDENILPLYTSIVFINDQIIILSNKTRFIMKIDKSTRTISKLADYPNEFRFLMNIYFYNHAFPAPYDVIGSKIWIHPVCGNMLLIYDVETNHFEGKELVVTAKQLPFLQNVITHNINQEICYESEDLCTLQNFLDVTYMLHNDETDESIGVGKKIYDALVR